MGLLLGACTPPPPDLCPSVTPAEVTFGTTSNDRKTVLVRNDGDALLHGRVQGVEAPFSVEGTVQAAFSIAAHDALPLNVVFQPRDGFSHLARMALLFDELPACSPSVTLTGTGPGDLIIVAQLDFGTLDVGSERIAELSWVNSSSEPAEVKEVAFPQAPEVFTLVDPLPLVVAPHALGMLKVRAKPMMPSFFSSQLIALTSVGTRTSRASVSTGVPVAQLEGAPFDVPEFGFTTGVGSVLRRVTLRNVGTPGTTPLQLVAPGLTVTQADGGPANGAIDFEGGFGPQFALPGDAFSFDLRISPKAEGDFTWLVQLFTTAPAQPVTTLTVHTNSKRLPGCTLDDTDGGSLDVRLDGTIATWPVTNVGTTPCLLDGPRIDAVDSFALVDGGFVQRWLAPGETHVFAVQARGPGRGELTFVGFTPEPTLIPITLNPR